MSEPDYINSSKCRKCMGMGWVFARVAVVCSVCLGTGEVQGKKCLSCAGSGEASVETEILCDQCQGVGSTSDNLSDSTPYA